MVRANQRLEVHEAISHILILRLKQILYLIECKQLSDIFVILRSNYALFSCILFEPFLLFLLVDHLRMVKEVTLQEEMLDFEHIHLRFASYQFGWSVILVFCDPILWKSVVEDAYFRECESQFSRILLPKDKLVNQLQIRFFMVMGMIAFRFKVVVSFNDYSVVLVEAHSFADGASTSFIVELVVLGPVDDLRSRHFIFIGRGEIQ